MVVDRDPGGRSLRSARFVARANRFVVRARLTDGQEVRAHLPNTARLTDVLVPGATLRLRANDDPRRRTRWTVTRVWDGTWVALEAAIASDLVADHLATGAALPGWPASVAVRGEVRVGDHRFDLEVVRADGVTGLVEVKSLSRARDRVAPLSATPSTRGVRHLAALADLARAGRAVGVVFVVQRDDVDVLDVAAPADPGWIAAVRQAAGAGVHLAAFACRVDEASIRLGRALSLRGLSSGAGSASSPDPPTSAP